jgi:CubicO group peptidase (beta-lactamase class C family)
LATISISHIESTPLQAVDRVLSRAVDAGRVPGVVSAVGSSETCRYRAAFGAAATDPYRPMAVDTIFSIASMTKLVTSVAIMILVDEGKVDLDAPLADYLPGFVQPEVLIEFDGATGRCTTRPASRQATIRELLSHSGGYGYWFLDEPLRVASGSDPDLFSPPFLIADPGTRFRYSTSADVVGQLVEPVTGLPLDDFFEARIFVPLGMPDTGFKRPAESARVAHVHRRSGKGFRQLPLDDQDNVVRGGGGLYSTAVDYSRLLRCLMRGGELDGTRLLGDSAVAEISRNQIGDFQAEMQRTALADRSNDFVFMDGTQKFGFGVMIETEQHPGKRSIGSYGWGGIVNTYFWVDPDRDLAAVLMMQIAPFASRASVELLDEFEVAVYKDWLQEGAV